MQKHFDELSALISTPSPAPSISTVSDSTMTSPSTSPTISSVSSDSHPTASSSFHTAPHPAPTLPANHNATRVAAALAAAVNDPGKARGRDRFPCTFTGCNLSFHRRYNLKVHFRKHTGEKPYACAEPGCNSAFKWRSSAKHHMIHHERLKAIKKTSTSPTQKSKPSPSAAKPQPQHPLRINYSHGRLPTPPKSIEIPMLPPMHPKMEDIPVIPDGLFIQHQPESFNPEDFSNLSAFNIPSSLPFYDPIFFPNDFAPYPFAN